MKTNPFLEKSIFSTIKSKLAKVRVCQNAICTSFRIEILEQTLRNRKPKIYFKWLLATLKLLGLNKPCYVSCLHELRTQCWCMQHFACAI